MTAAAGNRPVWIDLDLEPAPPMADLAGDTTADVCVIGAGASGLAAALEARALGASVLLIDAVGFHAAAAGRNGGLLVAGAADFHHDAVAALGRDRTLALTALTEAERDDEIARWPGLVRRTGCLRVLGHPDELADLRAQYEQSAADGLRVEWRDEPGPGLFTPDDAATNPAARVRALARDADRAGVRFVRAAARPFGGDGGSTGTVVRTAAGRISAGAVLVAVDGGLEELVPALGGRVRSTRLQMLAFAPSASSLPYPVSARWAYDYAHQLPDGRIVAGGCRDRFEADEWDAPAEPTEAVQAAIESWARGVLGASTPVTHRWAARVAYTPSRLPVCGCIDGPWVAGAYSGTGNLIGLLAGRAIARAAVTGDSALTGLLAGPESA